MSAEAAAPSPPGAHPRHDLRGRSHGRLRVKGTLALFGVTFALIVGVAAALTSLVAPTHHPVCEPFRPCGAPPGLSRPLVNLSVYRSAQAGFSLEYDGRLFAIAHQDAAGVTLGTQFTDGTTGVLDIQAAPGRSPSGAIADRVSALGGNIAELAPDEDPTDEILGAGVGLHSGSGAVFKGELSGPQGVSQTVVVAIESATHGGMTLTAIVLAAASHSGAQSALYSLADQIINSVKWPAGGSRS
jgi:hypothetical protein